MRPIFLLICLSLFISVGLVNASSVEKREEALPDSLLTEDHIYKFTFSDFNKALRIIELMREKNKLSTYTLDVAEGDLFFNTGKYYRALEFYNRVMESDSVLQSDQNYMEQVHRIISCYDCLHNDSKKIEYVELLLQKAKQCGNKEMEAIALFNMGKVLYYQGNKEKGLEYMWQGADLMKKTDYKYKYDNLRYNYNTLLVLEIKDRNFEDALTTLDLLEGVVIAQTNEEPFMEGLAEKEKKALYAHRAVVLFRLDRFAEAEHYYNLFRSLASVYDHDNYLIMPYLFDKGLYTEVIHLNSAREKFLQEHNDTVNYHMITIKQSLGNAYEALGNYKNSAKYFKELAVLRDSIKNREQASAAIELATSYETHEKESRIQKQDQELKIQKILLSVGACLIGLLLSILWIVWRNQRIVEGKNRAMARQINKLIVCEEDLDELRIQMKQHNDAFMKTEDDVIPHESISESASSERITAIANQIEQMIKEEQLYLNSQLSRDMILDRLHIDRNLFARAFQEGVGSNFASYVNELRINHSLKLMKQHPNYTIQAIATDSGFNNVRTYYRIFREKLNMSPAEYKKALESSL